MNKPLRILQIVPSVSLVYGGPSQMVLGLSGALAAEGVEVTILTTDANGDTGEAPLQVPLDRAVPQDGYQVRYFRCSPFRRYKFSLDLLGWLNTHAQEFDLAHIHALFSPVSTAAAMVARYRHLPYLLRPLGTLDPADLRKKRRLKQVYAALWERPNLAGAHGLHFTSEQEAKISERFGVTTRDLVVPLGVKPFQPQSDPWRVLAPLFLPQDKPLVLFMSRIDPKKGLDLLLPALAQLAQAGRPFHGVLAGSNPQEPQYVQQIQQQVQQLGLADQVTFTGFVSGETKEALLQVADLFVLPSYYENFGIAVAEAMVAGKPVVISDQVHIWPAVQQADAGWVCPCDATALHGALDAALGDPAEGQRRGLLGQAYALQYYSWRAIAQQMVQAYQAVLGSDSKSDSAG